MAAVDHDPLLLLRQSIASGRSIVPVTSPDSTDEAQLSQATHLQFTHPKGAAIPIDSPTRFISNETPVDLRSIYFAWLNREVAIPEYNASATKLNDDLGGAASVHKLAFVERLDLITWLEGASEESEYIKPLAGEKEAASAAAAALKSVSQPTATQSRAGRGTLDPRLAVIYNGERKMGDRNTALRGIKPTDFSHVRKFTASFTIKKQNSQVSGSSANISTLAIGQKPPKRPDPIILLSPSASSLLRMSNARAFLDGGRFQPVDNSSSAQTLHIQRIMKDIDPNRPMRFILVEGPEQFKPEYWNRVVAVFTTGQTWQFKNYRWSNPNDLFKHVIGLYVGWKGEQAPDNVRSWGHRVLSFQVDKWRDPSAPGADTSRWRDREVVESIWKAIENNMRSKGWKRDSGPTLV